jgi:hypothetical protein
LPPNPFYFRGRIVHHVPSIFEAIALYAETGQLHEETESHLAPMAKPIG